MACRLWTLRLAGECNVFLSQALVASHVCVSNTIATRPLWLLRLLINMSQLCMLTAALLACRLCLTAVTWWMWMRACRTHGSPSTTTQRQRQARTCSKLSTQSFFAAARGRWMFMGCKHASQPVCARVLDASQIFAHHSSCP